MKETYVTVTNEKIVYEAPKKVIYDFLLRVMMAGADPKVSTLALYDLIHGAGNPILRQGVVPGRGLVDQSVLNDPVYRIMLDQLALKRIARGEMDAPGPPPEAYTLSVAEAAEIIGISPQGVRNSLARGAWRQVMNGGRLMLHPDDVEQWRRKHEARGGAAGTDNKLEQGESSGADLLVRLGSIKGASFSVKHPAADLLDKRADGPRVWCGRIPAGWQQIAVKSSGGGRARVFVIEPGPEEREIEWKGFYLRGQFSVAEKVNDGAKASQRWKALEPT